MKNKENKKDKQLNKIINQQKEIEFKEFEIEIKKISYFTNDNHDDIEKLFKIIDVDDNKTIDFDEKQKFYSICEKYKNINDKKEFGNFWFDIIKRNGIEYIEKEEFKRCLKILFNFEIKENQFSNIWKKITDNSNTDKVSREQFLKIFE